jgi:hypothetical protein
VEEEEMSPDAERYKAAMKIYREAFRVAARAGFAMHDDYGANHDEACVWTDREQQCTCGFMDAIHAFCDQYNQRVEAAVRAALEATS